ncbi:hypothetical protein POHY109586_11080 [Polaromonas hydrogenivorans]
MRYLWPGGDRLPLPKRLLPKWNPIEHWLFSHISLNWAGKPLRGFESLTRYTSDTTTCTGQEGAWLSSRPARTDRWFSAPSGTYMNTEQATGRPVCSEGPILLGLALLLRRLRNVGG